MLSHTEMEEDQDPLTCSVLRGEKMNSSHTYNMGLAQGGKQGSDRRAGHARQNLVRWFHKRTNMEEVTLS